MELVIKEISKQYKGNIWGLRDFSLRLEYGVLALLGPNGAGKSTLMRILATITQPTKGYVTWNGAAIRFALIGQWDHVLAWGIGALFVPSFALALGVWSGSSKMFEVSFVILWYLGILLHIPVFDFFGITDLALSSGEPYIFMVATFILLGIACFGRRKQLYL